MATPYSRSGVLAAAVALTVSLGVAAESTEITDAASATRAAKRYTKGRCTAETLCTYKPEREGSQWRVWVQVTKRNAPSDPRSSIVLFFDAKGNLLRRLDAD